MREFNTTEELIYTAQLCLRVSKNVNASKLLKQMISITATRALNIKIAYAIFKTFELVKMYSEGVVLLLIMDVHFTELQYYYDYRQKEMQIYIMRKVK